MSVEIRECDPEVDIACDACDESIDESAEIFCAKCANRPVKHTQQCSVCKDWFPKAEMFSKIAGAMCHHCAFQYEAKAAGLLPIEKTAELSQGPRSERNL